MTERAFNKANELNKEIDRLCGKKKDLEDALELCWGDATEINKRIFSVRITERGSTCTCDVSISNDSVKLVLDQEIKKVEEALAALRKEFAEL